MHFRGKKTNRWGGWKKRRNCLLHTRIHEYMIIPSVTFDPGTESPKYNLSPYILSIRGSYI